MSPWKDVRGLPNKYTGIIKVRKENKMFPLFPHLALGHGKKCLIGCHYIQTKLLI